MKLGRLIVCTAIASFAALPAAAHAQIAIAPTIGAYVPAGSFHELETQGRELKKGGTLGLGLNLELGSLRGSLAYATGARIDEEGDVQDREEIGDGSVLVLTGAFVMRPIPRILVLQPYLLAGAGMKQAEFSYDDEGASAAFPKDERDLTVHLGLGADIAIGRLAILAEVNDFISQNTSDDWKIHDAFAMIGLKFRF